MKQGRISGQGRVRSLARLGATALLMLPFLACAARQDRPPAETARATIGVGFRDSDNSTTVELRHQADVGETTVPANVTAVWAVLPSVFEQLEIELTFIDASAGALGNEGYRARRVEGERMSRWLDCGRDLVQANADAYDVTLSVMVQLLVAPAGLTTVRTTVDAYARGRGVSGGRVHCVSWGTLERRIPELVVERLSG